MKLTILIHLTLFVIASCATIVPVFVYRQTVLAAIEHNISVETSALAGVYATEPAPSSQTNLVRPGIVCSNVHTETDFTDVFAVIRRDVAPAHIGALRDMIRDTRLVRNDRFLRIEDRPQFFASLQQTSMGGRIVCIADLELLRNDYIEDADRRAVYLSVFVLGILTALFVVSIVLTALRTARSA